MKKQYIQPQMVEDAVTLTSCICSGNSSAPVNDNPVDQQGGDVPSRRRAFTI